MSIPSLDGSDSGRDSGTQARELSLSEQARAHCGLRMEGFGPIIGQCLPTLATGHLMDFYVLGANIAKKFETQVTLNTLCSGTDGCVDALKARKSKSVGFCLPDCPTNPVKGFI